MGSQAHASAIAKAKVNDERTEMKSEPTPPPRGIVWWESLDTWLQLALSFPVFAILTFLLNIGPFGQPIGRSVFYGLFEGGVLTGLLAVATRTERDKRRKDH